MIVYVGVESAEEGCSVRSSYRMTSLFCVAGVEIMDLHKYTQNAQRRNNDFSNDVVQASASDIRDPPEFARSSIFWNPWLKSWMTADTCFAASLWYGESQVHA